MPTLDWIGKDAVVEHHKNVPYHLLRCDPDLSVGEASSGSAQSGVRVAGLFAANRQR